jgi:hypothetical protein
MCWLKNFKRSTGIVEQSSRRMMLEILPGMVWLSDRPGAAESLA